VCTSVGTLAYSQYFNNDFIPASVNGIISLRSQAGILSVRSGLFIANSIPAHFKNGRMAFQ
jgi:hypothetical protein